MDAGWRPDPAGRFAQRYYDGEVWTEHVADNLGGQLLDPSGPLELAAPPIPPPPRVAVSDPAVVNALAAGGFVRPRVSGQAVAALVLSLLWIYGLGSVAALILGSMALSRIRDSNGWVTGRAVAVTGIVLGWIGFALIVVLISF